MAEMEVGGRALEELDGGGGEMAKASRKGESDSLRATEEVLPPSEGAEPPTGHHRVSGLS